VARYCAAADLFVLPSLLEALPTVAVEALAAGTPVLSSDNPGGLELNDLFGPDVAIVPREQPIPLGAAISHFLHEKRRTYPGHPRDRRAGVHDHGGLGTVSRPLRACPEYDRPMTLLERISQDIAAAMRARDQARLGPLRMAKAALVNREVEKGRPLEDAEAGQVVVSLIKQRRDSIEQFTRGGRQDLVARETAEIAVLEAYLPPAPDPAEIEQAVDAAIAETGATSARTSDA
jgi:uncharacterized protein